MQSNQGNARVASRATSGGPLARTLGAFRSSQTWIRFGLIGILNTLYGYIVFALLVFSGVWPTAALAGTMILAVAFNFQTSRRLVFRSGGRFWRFITVYVVILTINSAALAMLRCYGLPDLLSQAFLTLPIAVLSYIGQNRFVFNVMSD